MKALNQENEDLKLPFNRCKYLVFSIQEQKFAIKVEHVQDVIVGQKINKIPLAPKEVIGSINLRGRIVTAINFADIMNIKPALTAHYEESADNSETQQNVDIEENSSPFIKPKSSKDTSTGIVIELSEFLYSLMVDKVHNVIDIIDDDIEATPSNLDSLWKELSTGVFLFQNQLILLINIFKLKL